MLYATIQDRKYNTHCKDETFDSWSSTSIMHTASRYLRRALPAAVLLLRGPTSFRVVLPLLHRPERVSLSEHGSHALRGSSRLCSASQVSIWLQDFLRFRNKRQSFFFVCFVFALQAARHERQAAIAPYGTGRGFAQGALAQRATPGRVGIRTTSFGGLKGQRLGTVYWSVQSRLGQPK